jgi:hypothetical protein
MKRPAERTARRQNEEFSVNQLAFFDRPKRHPAFAHKHPVARLIGAGWCLGFIAWGLPIALLRSSRAATPPRRRVPR